MILRLTNPVDEYDLLEVLRFCYRSTQGQVVKKTLTVRAVKFLKTSNGRFVYSDEPPLDLYVSDIDAMLLQDASDGKFVKMEALSKCFEATAELFTENGLTIHVEEV